MPTPSELRSFSELAETASHEYLIMAKQFPEHEAYYLKCASDRMADSKFWREKADRDEEWFGTKEYDERNAA